jgi:phage terminase Nu1 subunit (DNA packaging protein)
MTADLPDYYFRVRENGAVVFRLGTENRQRRIELDEIATVNVKNGNIKPHGEVELTAADRAAIEEWLAARQAQLAAREVDDILRTVDHLNLTTQWAQARATDAQLEAVTDALLLAMHDLRSMLVRRKADRLAKSD